MSDAGRVGLLVCAEALDGGLKMLFLRNSAHHRRGHRWCRYGKVPSPLRPHAGLWADRCRTEISQPETGTAGTTGREIGTAVEGAGTEMGASSDIDIARGLVLFRLNPSSPLFRLLRPVGTVIPVPGVVHSPNVMRLWGARPAVSELSEEWPESLARRV